MRKEKTLKPPLPFEDVIRIAQEVILRDGYHRPTVIVDGSWQNLAVQIDSLAPTHDGRAQQLFLLGAILAEHGEYGVLQQVFLISEAWMSVTALSNAVPIQPSQDPLRKEILAISRLQIEPRQTDMVVFEMKRNSGGKLIQLERQLEREGADTVESPLLAALAIGLLGIAAQPDD
jgi:hypothetical protein